MRDQHGMTNKNDGYTVEASAGASKAVGERDEEVTGESSRAETGLQGLPIPPCSLSRTKTGLASVQLG
jgi:hypothetical protein